MQDIERARAIFELAISQPELDMPEILWKAYIDFEVGEEEWEKARDLYSRLLERTAHVKVWISWAHFEASVPHEGRAAAARDVFKKASQKMKEQELKEERVILLEAWKEFEQAQGTAETLKAVQDLMPKMVKKRRQIASTSGVGESAQYEEYYDYIFPDDQTQKPNFKLISKAHEWKLKVRPAPLSECVIFVS